MNFCTQTIWTLILGCCYNSLLADTILIPTDHSSIQLGISNAGAGDTVLVQDGVYYENDIYLQGKELVLMSMNGAKSTIIDGANLGKIFRAQNGESYATEINGFTIQNGQSTEGSAIYVINDSYLTVRNCIIRDNVAPGTWTFGAVTIGKEGNLGANSMASVQMYDCEFVGNTGYYGSCIFYWAEGNVQSVFSRCTFRENTAYHGAAFYSTQNAVIEKCLFTSNVSTGTTNAVLHNEGGNPEVINCTFADNECFAIGRQDPLDTTTVRNCIFYGNAGTLTEVSDITKFDFQYCNDEDANVGESNIAADPLFDMDYHLTEDSPCIDMGDPSSIYNDPDHTRNDIGAFYYNQSPFVNGVDTRNLVGAQIDSNNIFLESPAANGIIFKDENGSCWKMTVDTLGQAQTWRVVCPGE